MHTDQSMMKKTATKPTEGDLKWTLEKFKAIGTKGKENLLRYLAIKTGSEFRTHQNGNGPGQVRVRARNDDYKISYYRTSDSIKISWRRHSTTPLAKATTKVRAEVEGKARERQQGREWHAKQPPND